MTYAIRRILLTPLLLVAVSFVVFGLAEAIPGDPADARFQRFPERKEVWRSERGLDDPFLERWGRYVWGVATRFDLDRSYKDDRPVGGELGRKLQATLELTLFALLVAILVGGAAGILSAVFPRTPVDYGGSVLALCGISMPVFWLGMLLIVFASRVLDLPVVLGRIGHDVELEGFHTQLFFFESLVRGRWEVFGSALHHLLLPGLALATIPMAVITRMTRSAMLDEIGKDYVTTARAKGISGRRVVLKHVLRNALIPVTTITGIQFGQLMSGAVLTETVFSWPGLGSFVVEQGVLGNDTPIVVGGVLLISATFVVVNLVVDLLYAAIDPRVRQT